MSQETRSPAASLGLLDATMVGMGAMIGAGIFVLTGLAADIAGPAAILVFALNGVVTAFTGLSYAELASAIPKSGGGYAFVEEVFSDSVSFLMGWMLWFAYMIAGALYALGFASNFVEFVRLYWPGLPTGAVVAGGPQWHVVYALLVVVGFVSLNALSTSASGGAETAVTLVKIAILLVFVAFGVFAADAGHFSPLFPGGRSAASLLPAMGLTFIAFEGYDLITTVTEEVKNPRENIPKAIFLSLAATVVIYLLVVFVAIGTLGADQLGAAGETAIAQAAETFMPRLHVVGTGAALVAFGAVFSTISALNAVVLASSRIAFAMGRDRLFPAVLGRLHPRYGTPYAAVLASAVVMLLSVAFVPIQQVGNLSSLFFLLSFVVVNASVVKLRRERPNLRRPYEMPFYPVPPVLGILLNLVLGFFIDPTTWAMGLGWLALGGATFVVSRRAGGLVGPDGDDDGDDSDGATDHRRQ
ncbi:MAG: APC family permease [Haloplanus sp.]